MRSHARCGTRGDPPRRAQRLLVATPGRRRPRTALDRAAALAGPRGAVVLVVVTTLHSAPSFAMTHGGSVTRAHGVPDEDEPAGADGPSLRARHVQARSFAEGVLEILADEPFDMLVLECERWPAPNDAARQIEMLLDRARLPVTMVRPA